MHNLIADRVTVTLTVNGRPREIMVEPRTTLLDALREELAMHNGKRITTIEGLEEAGQLHPIQSAFIEHDAFQCGFCTSGQIMSATAMLVEARAGWPSAASADLTSNVSVAGLTAAEIRERMSDNLCRCACYPNIVDAISDAGSQISSRICAPDAARRA